RHSEKRRQAAAPSRSRHGLAPRRAPQAYRSFLGLPERCCFERGSARFRLFHSDAQDKRQSPFHFARRVARPWAPSQGRRPETASNPERLAGLEAAAWASARHHGSTYYLAAIRLARRLPPSEPAQSADPLEIAADVTSSDRDVAACSW